MQSKLTAFLQSRKDYEKALVGLVSCWIKKNFGKGPKKIVVNVYDYYMLVRSTGMLSKAELKLCRTDQGEMEVKMYRQRLLKAALPSLKKKLYSEIGIPVSHFFYDCNPEVNESILMIIYDDDLEAKLSQGK